MLAKPRPLLTLLLALTATCAFAGPLFGTKPDALPATTGPTPGLGMAQFCQMLLALGIVFVLVKFGMPKLLGIANRKLTNKAGGNIRVEESVPFAGGQLHLVRVGGKTLLLSSCSTGARLIAEIESGRQPQEKPLFMDILDNEVQSPTHLYVDETGEPTPAMRTSMTEDEVQAALHRLNLFSS